MKVDDQGKYGKEGLQEVTRKKEITRKEVERTVKDREKSKALWEVGVSKT
jgi:hypothetical protein